MQEGDSSMAYCEIVENKNKLTSRSEVVTDSEVITVPKQEKCCKR
jgi:hypothetical protein